MGDGMRPDADRPTSRVTESGPLIHPTHPVRGTLPVRPFTFDMHRRVITIEFPARGHSGKNQSRRKIATQKHWVASFITRISAFSG